jgi:shikimate kinase
MKVYLVGMPGSGKSTLGKELGRHLSIPFVDLDQEIEKSERKKIPEIFSSKGEAHFRQAESRLLQSWANSTKDFVMATGGGAPCFHRGMELINRTGVSIFLNVSVNEILERIKNNNDRPLLAGDLLTREQKILEIARVRLPFYQQAHFTFTEPTLDGVLAAIHSRTINN